MEIRDYLRMLRRGWLAILVITALFLGSAGIYLVLVPQRYDAGTTLFVSAANMQSIDDLQQGSQFAKGSAATYAEIIDSVTVLGDVAVELRPQMSVDELATMVEATVRPSTALIDIGVSGTDREQVATIANAVGSSAVEILPRLERTRGGRSLVKVQQIRQAVEPVRAASPNAKRTMALAVVVGLCVGLAGTIVAQTLDSRIRRVEEVRQLADVPLLATVPRLPRSERRGLVVREKPHSEVGEAFRALRTNISFLESDDRRSLLIAAAANSSDGALLPANLAWTLAQTGQRILLVDLDLRRSTVGELLGMGSGDGMSDVLAGQCRLLDAIRATDHPRLSVVLSGTTQPSPSELLGRPAMASLVDWMERHYDHVIVHAPPLLSYTDATVVSTAVGGTLVSVAAGSTHAQQLTTALVALANVRVRPMGLILTQVHASSSDFGRMRGGTTRLRPGGEGVSTLPVDWDYDQPTTINGSYEPARARPDD